MSEFVQLPRALRLLREERGLTQVEVAKRGGTAPGTVGGSEAGNRELEIESLDKILTGLGANRFDLVNALERAAGRPALEFRVLEPGPRPPRAELLELVGLDDLSRTEGLAVLAMVEVLREWLLGEAGPEKLAAAE